MLKLSKPKSHKRLESCFLWGFSEADRGAERLPPASWNKAEAQAWLKGYDSYGEQELKNAA